MVLIPQAAMHDTVGYDSPLSCYSMATPFSHSSNHFSFFLLVKYHQGGANLNLKPNDITLERLMLMLFILTEGHHQDVAKTPRYVKIVVS